MAESEDMVELEWEEMDDLGVSQDYLEQLMDEEEERLEEDLLQKELESQCLEEAVQQKAYMIELYENGVKALKKFKMFWNNLGMEYPETDLEEEDPSKPTEVIEIPNEDDVMSLDSADIINKVAKDHPLLSDAFLDLRKSAQDIQNFRDTVKTKSGSLDSRGASAALADSEDTLKQEIEETTIKLDKLKQRIDTKLEVLEDNRLLKILKENWWLKLEVQRLEEALAYLKFHF